MTLADGFYPDDEDRMVDDTLAGSDDVVDLTPEPDPEDFDFDAFVQGARPGRRGVWVTQRPDLMLKLDELSAEAGKVRPGDKDAEESFRERFESIKQQIEESRRMFVIEARSQARLQRIKDDLAEQGITEPDDLAGRKEFRETLALHRLADAIVSPKNVTVEGLRSFYKVSESEVNRLFGAFNQVLTNPVDGIGVSADFLLRR